jgi:hypothetical protein
MLIVGPALRRELKRPVLSPELRRASTRNNKKGVAQNGNR